MNKLLIFLILFITRQFLVPVAHYTISMGPKTEQYGGDCIEGLPNTFAISPDSRYIIIPDARKNNIKLVYTKDGTLTLLNIPFPYNDIYVDSLWQIYFYSFFNKLIYIYSTQGKKLDSFPIPPVKDYDLELTIQQDKPLLRTDRGMWNILTRKFETQYYEADINDNHLDFFLVKDGEPNYIFSTMLQSLDADSIYKHPEINYIGQLAEHYVFYTYDVFYNGIAYQLLIMDKKGNLIQHIPLTQNPDYELVNHRTAIIKDNKLFTLAMTFSVDITIYKPL